jgi:hypothetical protein
MRLIGRVGRLPSMFHGGGDGRTYSGVWPGGQAARKPVFSAVPGTSGGWRDATDFKAAWRKALVGGTSDMALLSSKKRESRKSLSQPGWITLEGGFAARQCVVKDLSTTGAKVTIDDPNSLPAKLRLAFSRDARTGRRCEVVWRRGKSVGVKFVR